MTTGSETLVENGSGVDATNQTEESGTERQGKAHSADAFNQASAETSSKRSISGEASAEAAEGSKFDQVNRDASRVEANIDVSKSPTKDSKPNQRRLITQRADQITPRRLCWLWPDRIPLGSTTVFAGMPGEGKSLATVDIAARVTTGTNYPDVKNPLPAGGVLFIAEEDDPQEVLVPRLKAAGANLSKVHILAAVREDGKADDRLRLDRDIRAIEKFLAEHQDTRLVVIDPISNHLGNVPMTDEQEVRKILGPLNEVAKAHNVAIICVMHLNKKEGLSAIHRVGGAGAFIGVARASWIFGRNPEASGKRFMLPLKNNYGRNSCGLGYRICETPVKIENDDVLTPHIEWLDEVDLDIDEIFAVPKKNPSSLGQAKLFLGGFLAGGPRDASAVVAAATADGISERTLDRAKAELRVESRKKGTEGWEWVLPNDQPKDANEAHCADSTVGNLLSVSLSSIRE